MMIVYCFWQEKKARHQETPEKQKTIQETPDPKGCSESGVKYHQNNLTRVKPETGAPSGRGSGLRHTHSPGPDRWSWTSGEILGPLRLSWAATCWLAGSAKAWAAGQQTRDQSRPGRANVGNGSVLPVGSWWYQVIFDKIHIENIWQDIPGDSVVKVSPSNGGGAGYSSSGNQDPT